MTLRFSLRTLLLASGTAAPLAALATLATLANLAGACAATGDAVIGHGDEDAAPDVAITSPAPDAAKASDTGGGGDACATQCGGSCVDTAIDPLNCGKCGVTCGAHETCAQDKCVCALSTCPSDAGSVCIDTSTDPDNCGACGKPCPSGVCSNGTCGGPTVLATDLVMPAALAIDGANLCLEPGRRRLAAGSRRRAGRALLGRRHRDYWIEVNGSTINAVPKAGGAATVIATDVYSPIALVATGGRVFWTNGTAVMSAPRAGGAAIAFLVDQAPYAIATDGTSLYWTNYSSGVKGAVRKCAVGNACGTPFTIASGQDEAFALAIDATSVYWTSNDAIHGKVLKAPK